MTLEEYKQKRDFDKTPEPGPRAGQAHRQPIFVVQEHHATRSHYDFRLEADGVLKSWAVTKEPTLDPAVKRLAVPVEDHPLDYADFSGDIPKGQYGAGHVEIWDKGTYENVVEATNGQSITEGIAAGRLEIELHGQKLKGKFVLLRMQGGGFRKRGDEDNWLLIKMKDDEARPGTAPQEKRKAEPAEPRQPSKAAAARAGQPPAKIEFAHEDKIMFPEGGITKGDVLRFYERIAERLLPHLRDRPVTLERLPEGLSGDDAPHFWQKNTPSHYPAWIPRVELPSERGKPVQYALVNAEKTLLYLVNQGALTFHVWFSRIQNLDRPDFVLFDLDPGKATFADAVQVAKQLHVILKAEKIKPFLKTSGKTGLHVLVPWQGEGDDDAAREWALQVAGRLVEALPDIATLERSKSKRRGRLYVDVMQNVRGHHAVPPYVLRAVPAATVSTPLEWDELTPDLDPRQFNLKTIFRRLAHQDADPIAPLIKGYRRKK